MSNVQQNIVTADYLNGAQSFDLADPFIIPV